MDTKKFLQNRGVKMIAHRGVSGLEKENTLPAFLLACERSYFGIETDVRVTKDKQFVLFHDDDLKRCFGIEKRVDECDFDYLRSLRFCVDGEVREDLFIPTPKEYFDLCKRYDKEAVFELKGGLTDEEVGRLVALVKECGWIEKTTFISFYQDYLLSVRRYEPSAKAYYLAGHCTEQEDAFMVENGIHADIQYATLSKERIEKYKAQGIKINCWTVDDVEAAERLQDLGVDYITSNILE